MGEELVATSAGRSGEEDKTKSDYTSFFFNLVISHEICVEERKKDRQAGSEKAVQWEPAEAAKAMTQEARRADSRRAWEERDSGSGCRCSGKRDSRVWVAV